LYKLDELDKQILTILQEDGRASNVSIAKKLGTGHTRIRDRILRMEKAGIIASYRAVVDPTKLGLVIPCTVQLKVDQSFDFDEVVNQLLSIDEVVEVANVTGEFDAHIQLWAKDVNHLRKILYDRLSTLPAHQSTNSAIVLERWQKPLGFSFDE
jgi:Lrp/AsnC family transcriptional regulator for asnA, asnC and gidA